MGQVYQATDTKLNRQTLSAKPGFSVLVTTSNDPHTACCLNARSRSSCASWRPFCAVRWSLLPSWG